MGRSSSLFGIVGAVEDLANLARDGLGRERFPNESRSRPQNAVAQDGVVSVSRHVKQLHVRVQELQAVGQILPAHSRHHHIGQQQRDRSPGVACRWRWPRRRTSPPEPCTPILPKYPARATGRASSSSTSRMVSEPRGDASAPSSAVPVKSDSLLDPGQINLEGGALPRLAVHADVTFALPDDPIDG